MSAIDGENDGFVYINRFTGIHWYKNAKTHTHTQTHGSHGEHKKYDIHAEGYAVHENPAQILTDCWLARFIFFLLSFFHGQKAITLKFHKFQIDIASYITPSIDFGLREFLSRSLFYCSHSISHFCLFGGINWRSAFYYSKIDIRMNCKSLTKQKSYTSAVDWMRWKNDERDRECRNTIYALPYRYQIQIDCVTMTRLAFCVLYMDDWTFMIQIK